jgi:hypothetical protein
VEFHDVVQVSSAKRTPQWNHPNIVALEGVAERCDKRLRHHRTDANHKAGASVGVNEI